MAAASQESFKIIPDQSNERIDKMIRVIYTEPNGDKATLEFRTGARPLRSEEEKEWTIVGGNSFIFLNDAEDLISMQAENPTMLFGEPPLPGHSGRTQAFSALLTPLLATNIRAYLKKKGGKVGLGLGPPLTEAVEFAAPVFNPLPYISRAEEQVNKVGLAVLDKNWTSRETGTSNAVAGLPKDVMKNIGDFLRNPKKGGKRRLMSVAYCKKTPCRKMGFTQKASCRPTKNCYRKTRRRLK
jgi:hypothetical protein